MISLRSVAVHNLKNIDLDLPLGKLIVFCGRSGSGKSSLALDTLYAEGQRRYIETFSPVLRQFLEKIEKPAAKRLDGIPPAVAVTSTTQKMESMTVGEVAEVNDDLAMLFAQSGHVFCPKCSRLITAHSPQTIWKTLLDSAEKGTKLQIMFPPLLEKTSTEFATLWKEQGFLRGWFGGQTFRLTEPIPLEFYREGLLLIADRLTFSSAEEDRTIESLESALNYGEGQCALLLGDQILPFSKTLSCSYCQIHVPPLTARLFQTDWKHHIHLHADIHSTTLGDLTQRTVTELIEFFENADTVGNSLLPSLLSRLRFLQQVGLGYLTLSRPMDTLSGGEQRRTTLAAVLGSSLVNMLYVLDEPSLGLHPKDTTQMLEAILTLRDRGNTVILVEHDKQLLFRSDHIVEIGPGAGENGGTIVFQGSVDELRNDPKSLTGKYLYDSVKAAEEESETNVPLFAVTKTGDSPPSAAVYNIPSILIVGCRGHNLKNMTASFPLGGLCVVTGVSGAGKSSLVRQTLYPALCQHFEKKCDAGLPFDQIHVRGNINDVVLIDQTPMKRSSSSNPATYLKIFDEIRSIFAETVDAKAKNMTARHFSFNVSGGRCEHCKGEGNLVIDMQFLPDQIIPCPECSGKRYQHSVLNILYRGKTIVDVLDMTAREAFTFFRGQSKLQQKLRVLFDVGLDYIRLGQPSRTLSGGEAQRLRLATHLGQIRWNRSLILMDEPTAGLHFADVEQMLACFQSLITSGHSLIVIEHHEMVIQAADHQIELGPGAGENGGTIVR